MSNTGIRTAKPPVSPHANLMAIERVATSVSGSAIWQVACTCGLGITAAAPGIRCGETKCPRCQPPIGDAQAMEILMLLPMTQDELALKLGIHSSTLKSRIRVMKKAGLCHTGRWRRPKAMGSFQPVIVAGPGEDVPCKLTPGTNADHKRKYRKRIRNAIARAQAGGKEDPRYIRHIRLKQVNAKVQQAKVVPQTWLSALM